MLLLYLHQGAHALQGQTVSTFHYASTLSIQLNACSFKQILSTFHYASTLSLDFCRIKPGDPISTFHYASTLSVILTFFPLLICIYIPLCFYFIGFGCMIPLSNFSIYIPLCFYFIGVPSENVSLSVQSTFHYASTLSGYCAV